MFASQPEAKNAGIHLAVTADHAERIHYISQLTLAIPFIQMSFNVIEVMLYDRLGLLFGEGDRLVNLSSLVCLL